MSKLWGQYGQAQLQSKQSFSRKELVLGLFKKEMYELDGIHSF